MSVMPTNPTERAHFFQKYYEGKQYNNRIPFLTERDASGNYVPIKNRRPNVRYNLCRAVCNRMVGFLMGEQTFPVITTEDADANEVLKWIRGILAKIAPSALLKACVQGSVALTFGFVRGKLLVRSFSRTMATPIFDDADELLGLVVTYCSRDPKTGKECEERITLDGAVEILERREGQGKWEVVDRKEHGFGFVPAVWVRHLVDETGSIDGQSLLEELTELQEEVDYLLSQRGRALRYSADPQTIVKDESPEKTIERLIKAPSGTWLVGKDGKVEYLEISGAGIELQGKAVLELRKFALEVARVVLPDPDNVKGQLSGFALRIMYESMIDLADQLKVSWNSALVEFVVKLALAAKVLEGQNKSVSIPKVQALTRLVSVPSPITEPVSVLHPSLGSTPRDWPLPVYATAALTLSTNWGDYFDISPDEEEKLINGAVAAKNGGLVSTETGVRFIGPHLGVTDVDGEVARIREEQGGLA